MPAGKQNNQLYYKIDKREGSFSLFFLFLEQPITNENTYSPIGSCVSDGLFFLLRIYARIDNELLEGGKKECMGSRNWCKKNSIKSCPSFVCVSFSLFA